MPKRRGGRRKGGLSRSGSNPRVTSASPSRMSTDSSTSGKAAQQNSLTKEKEQDVQKTPLAEPVEQRWEENEGKYLHKKFKKMASSKVEPEAPNTTSAAQTLSSVTATDTTTSAPPYYPHQPPLKHSALSMITSTAAPVTTQNNPLYPRQTSVISAEVRNNPLCPICRIVCKHPAELDKHIRIHVNGRPFPCLPCGFAFRTKTNLIKHEQSRTHSLRKERGIVPSSLDILEELGDDGKYEIENQHLTHRVNNNLLPSDDQIASLPLPYHPSIRPPQTPQDVLPKPRALYPPPSDAFLSPATVNIHQMTHHDLILKQHQFSSPGLGSEPQQTAPTDLSSKKTAETESLKQRIDKVISQNQAIVETLDPLWPRRYMRQNSREEDKSGNLKGGRKYSLTTPSALSTAQVNTLSTSRKTETLVEDSSSSLSEQRPINLVSSVKVDKQKLDQQPLELRIAQEQLKSIQASIQKSSSSVVNVQSPLNLTEPASVPKAVVSNRGSPLASAQSVKEVWMKSIQQGKTGTMAQLEGIANNLGDKPCHPSNPEGSMIKELLLHSRCLGVPQTASDSPAITEGGALKIKTIDREGQQQRTSLSSQNEELVRCSRCSMVMKRADIENHYKFQCNKSTSLATQSPPEKRAKLVGDVTIQTPSSHLYSGGVIQKVPAPANNPGLLQISQPRLQSGGEVMTLTKPNSSENVHRTIHQPIPISMQVSTTPFHIPGVPTPNLSGVLSNIKTKPLFSLPGQRYPSSLSEDSSSKSAATSSIPFVLGIPGPYSQPQPVKVIVPTNQAPSSVNKNVPQVNNKVIPEITVSTIEDESENGQKSPIKESEPRQDSKFLRPNSLSLTPGSFKQKKMVMVASAGATLVSPETPRPRKSYVLTYQNGTAYTHLGMKCSTRVYYCSTFKQQPMYVSCKPRLSMYSNWKIISRDSHPSGLSPKQSLESYNSVERLTKYGKVTIAKAKSAMIVAHSSQWKTENGMKTKNQNKRNDTVHERSGKEDEKMDVDDDEVKVLDSSTIMTSADNSFVPPRQVEGGYKTTDENYTYVRGRGRGRYVCNSCGIRCKKPSMLKKHIRTHTNFRPYTCKFCNFSFKTKGNLTKHMKSKAHHKKCVELGISPVPTNVDEANGQEDSNGSKEEVKLPNGETVPGDSDSDTDDDNDDEEDEEDEDQFEDADESMEQPQQENTRIQGLLPTGRPKPSSCTFATATTTDSTTDSTASVPATTSSAKTSTPSSIPAVSPVSQQLYEYAKSSVHLPLSSTSGASMPTNLLHVGASTNSSGKYYFNSLDLTKTTSSQEGFALTPQVTIVKEPSPPNNKDISHSLKSLDLSIVTQNNPPELNTYLQERAAIRARFINQENTFTSQASTKSPSEYPEVPTRVGSVEIIRSPPLVKLESGDKSTLQSSSSSSSSVEISRTLSSLSSGSASLHSLSYSLEDCTFAPRNVTMNVKDLPSKITNGKAPLSNSFTSHTQIMPKELNTITQIKAASVASANFSNRDLQPSSVPVALLNSIAKDASHATSKTAPSKLSLSPPASNHHNKPALHSNQDVITTNSEGKPMCGVCQKVFAKPVQLRLHAQIHYMERPFKCEECGISFRTKGHLSKHERSETHRNKVKINQTFGAPSSSNPRPFKCDNCLIPFRIHGHLAKHLRSKSHIMKLECSGKLPIGMYTEIEHLGINLNEIDTTSCDKALLSLQKMAENLFANDPSKLAFLRRPSDFKSSAQTNPDTSKTPHSNENEIKTEPPNEETDQDLIQQNNNQADQLQNPSIRSPTIIAQQHSQGNIDHPSKMQTEGRRISFSSGAEDRSTDSDGEHSNQKISCQSCLRSFTDMKSLQIHVFVDHHKQSQIQPQPINGEIITRSDNSNLSSPAKAVSPNPSISTQYPVSDMSSSSARPSPGPSSMIAGISRSISREGSVASSTDGEDSSANKLFNCELCDRVLPNRAALKEHLLQAHAAPRPFVCSECDAGFTTSHQLQAHLKLH